MHYWAKRVNVLLSVILWVFWLGVALEKFSQTGGEASQPRRRFLRIYCSSEDRNRLQNRLAESREKSLRKTTTRAAGGNSCVASQSRRERTESRCEQENRWISGWDRNPLARARRLSSRRDHDQNRALASRGVLLAPRACVGAVKYKSSQTIQKRGDPIFHTPEHHETHTRSRNTLTHIIHTLDLLY